MSTKQLKHKILFLDIDGPMIPARAYVMAGQTKPFVRIFDPCAVGLINELCEKRGYKIVLHSSWIRIEGGQQTYDHCIFQGLKSEHFHEDAWCDENTNWRYTRVAMWLKAHPETTHYLIMDDKPYEDNFNNDHVEHPKDMEDHLVLIDFQDGILWKTMNMIHGKDFSVKPPSTPAKG